MASIQFTGLSSGLDTDSIVKAMLSTYQSRIDNAENEKTVLTWKQEQWSSVNDKINTFYTNYIDKLRLQSTFESYAVSTSSWAVDVKKTSDMPIGTHSISVTKLATSAETYAGEVDSSITSKTATLKNMGLLEEGDTFTIKVNADKDGNNGTEIKVSSSDTLSTIEKALKAADETLNVNFDIKNKKLFISSNTTGTESKINIKVDYTDAQGKIDTDAAKRAEKAASALGFSTTDAGIQSVGEAGSYKYNGIEMTADTNEVQVNGLSLTLRETGDVKIEVKSDPDSVVSFINEFVSAYNTLIADLNTLYSATKIDTTPLTDDEKAEMTEKQIDEYEQNIKNSLLRRDSSLKTVIDTLRTSMQQVVSDNTFGSLAAVGITTGDYSENGKLYVDETTLKAALEKDPEAVKNLFTGTGTKDADGKVVSNTVGLATRLNTNMQALFKSVTGIKSYKSYYNDKVTKDKITSMTNKISDLQDKYDAMEEIYYAKFTAMEKAMATLNSQSSSFLSMLG